MKIGLVGDYNASHLAHQAVPRAVALASEQLEISVTSQWISTDTIGERDLFADYDGIWCVPGSPYRNMDGALRAIRVARETNHPFLGTCGGFQHAMIEYARNVLGWADAEHGETAPTAVRRVITPLSCSMVEATGVVHFMDGSHLATAYGTLTSHETYHCRYGLNPTFVVTLFQPERAALEGVAPPIVIAFLRSVESTAHEDR